MNISARDLQWMMNGLRHWAEADISIDFFKKVQNKIHYAVHGQTAAEVIYNRADSEKEFMGLTTFKGNRPHLSDTKIAKNYLDEKELRLRGETSRA